MFFVVYQTHGRNKMHISSFTFHFLSLKFITFLFFFIMQNAINTAEPSSMQDTCEMELLTISSCSSVVGASNLCLGGHGSILVGDLEFFFVPRSRHAEYFTFHKRNTVKVAIDYIEGIIIKCAFLQISTEQWHKSENRFRSYFAQR